MSSILSRPQCVNTHLGPLSPKCCQIPPVTSVPIVTTWEVITTPRCQYLFCVILLTDFSSGQCCYWFIRTVLLSELHDIFVGLAESLHVFLSAWLHFIINLQWHMRLSPWINMTSLQPHRKPICLQFAGWYELAFFQYQKPGHGCLWINSLWSSDVIWWHRSESTFCCLMAAPSHYLDQCCLMMPSGIYLRAIWQEMQQISILDMSFKITDVRL